MIKIQQLKKADKAAVRDLNHLLKQLRKNPSEHSGSLFDLRNIVSDKKIVMIVAQNGRNIVGMATLYIIIMLGKTVGTVEEVVVDSAYRGKGLGKKILQMLIRVARKKKVKKLYLTSRPSRVAANKLYQKLGFKLKETNPYTLRL
ncbi:MAG: GNAT family N-acetyltransferase [Candidatus Liptonbacteria bacterium]|nr:GNAT family N-acetyltransferase [Candidatus Liptonbacteria bacterium]